MMAAGLAQWARNPSLSPAYGVGDAAVGGAGFWIKAESSKHISNLCRRSQTEPHVLVEQRNETDALKLSIAIVV
jgi:hypothetical protein